MAYFGVTDVGSVRKMNQDVWGERAFPFGLILVVCDGMGGAASGEIASGLARDAFLDSAAAALAAGEPTKKTAAEALFDAALAAGRVVRDDADANSEHYGMGTTLVGCAVLPYAEVDCEIAVVANIGDSRAYLITQQGIRQITEDHSVVAEMVANGEITKEQARVHPRRNLITKALGSIIIEEPDIFAVKLRRGSRILLCSDGLCGVLTDSELLRIARRDAGVREICAELIKAAIDCGAPDNVTAVIYENDGGTIGFAQVNDGGAKMVEGDGENA